MLLNVDVKEENASLLKRPPPPPRRLSASTLASKQSPPAGRPRGILKQPTQASSKYGSSVGSGLVSRSEPDNGPESKATVPHSTAGEIQDETGGNGGGGMSKYTDSEIKSVQPREKTSDVTELADAEQKSSKDSSTVTST